MSLTADNKTSRCLSALFALALFLFILTASIALPIYIRPFYYAHIEAMHLPEQTGYTAPEIREAYDQVLDYLTKTGKPFGTGTLAHSADGAAHFADCKVLFDLDKYVLLGSAAVLAVLLALQKAGKTGPYRLGRRSGAFWGALGAVILPLVVGSLAALDFDRAFVIFHSIFFPGKTNWLFDPRTDPIILVLPQEFFMHCAVLIGAGLLAMAAGLLLFDYFREKASRR